MLELTRKEARTWAVFVCLSFSLTSAEIVTQPLSTSVLLGQDASFSCAGKAFAILWIIDNTNVEDLGLEPTNDLVDGVRVSNLTINGHVENNKISIQCLVYVTFSSPPVISVPAILTVLGIGQVPFIKIVEVAHPPYHCIQWNEPSFVSADVTDLTYNISLSGADQTTLNTTTTETNDCPAITPCQEFIIIVTPFSPSLGYVGANNSTTDYIDGGNYELEDPCVLLKVEFVDVDSVICSFVCKVVVPTVACPNQFLSVMTTAKTNSDSMIKKFSNVSLVLLDGTKTSININSAELPAGAKYFSNFSIKNLSGGVIDIGETSLYFSSHSVQDAAFSYLPSASAVNVTCYFATNAFASACMARFENASLGLAFNGTVDHPHSLLNSSGNVTIPREVFQRRESHITFDVKVFDVDENGNMAEKPAIEQDGALDVVLNHEEPTPDTSTRSTMRRTSASAIPSVSSVEETNIFTITTVVVSVIIVLVIITVSGMVTVLICIHLRRKRGRVKISHPTHRGVRVDEITEDSHGTRDIFPNASHTTFVGGEETPYSHQSAPTSSDGYPAMNWLEPKPGDNQYEKLNSHPSNAQYSPQGKKDSVVYAELGSRPANAPPVLPLDTSVHYMTVKKSPTP